MLRSFDDAYYPNIMVRPAEMQALKELPENVKDSIFPIIKLCPWTTAKEFKNTHDKIIEVLDERPIICDLDDYYSSDKDRPAISQFYQARNSIDAWVEMIVNNPSYIPCVRMHGYSIGQIENQIRNFHSLERGFALKFDVRRLYDYERIVNLLEGQFSNIPASEYCVIVDAGVIEKADISEASVLNVVRKFIGIVGLRIIISSASFPSAFTKHHEITREEIKSRILFANILRSTNYEYLSYSDWGSTKPRNEAQGGSGIVIPRIDYPIPSFWVTSRNRDEGWNYNIAAQKMMTSEFWKNAPNVWGVGKIMETAAGSPNGISNPRQNTSARINIHLFVQNYYGSDAGSITTDEAWED